MTKQPSVRLLLLWLMTDLDEIRDEQDTLEMVIPEHQILRFQFIFLAETDAILLKDGAVVST
ncbi:hypothetical protein HQN87_24235 [Paenibacillus tritici]|uniref:Uncharacterized protein n=1 Tax=Paenibacillus tritici TaxID=1873425 RepID=A0ABX2DV33_9BACL|nr:hypothetical protein [Paenibacillus tritici]NQX48442.1 hypothetical protein [Paenibacillus tritici]